MIESGGAAVEIEGFAGGMAERTRDKIRNHGGNILRLKNFRRFDVFLSHQGLKHLGIDGTGSNGDNANTERSTFAGGDAREHVDADLGDGIGAESGKRVLCGAGGDIDDGAGVVCGFGGAFELGLHDRPDGSGGVEGGGEVGAEECVPLVVRRLHEFAAQHHAGIVDENVDSAPRSENLLDHAVDSIAVGHVGDNGKGGLVLLLELVCESGEGGFGAADECESIAEVAEAESCGTADAPGGSSDDGDFLHGVHEARGGRGGTLESGAESILSRFQSQETGAERA